MNAESDTHTEDKITDPIGLSLQASIADEHTAYRQLEKPRQDSLFDAKTLDIWEGPNGARVYDHNYGMSRGLPNGLFDASHPSVSGGARLILRLLVTHPALASNQLAWHDDLAKPGNKQINFLPFTPEAMEDLIHQWDLPRDWTWLRLNAREVGNFARKTQWDFSVTPPRAVRMGFVVNFPFVLRPARQLDFLQEVKGGKTAGRRKANSDFNPWRDDPFIWSLAMSHSLRDGKTRGLLDGITDWAFDDISRRILGPNDHWYMHPLHVPYVLLSIVFDHSAWEINRLAIDVVEFEGLSKDAETSSLEKFDAITTQLQYVRRNLDFQNNLVSFMIDTMKFLEEKVLIDPKKDSRQEPSRYVSYIFETNRQVEEKLTNLTYLIKNNSDSCVYLQARTKDAMDYITAAISLRDNESNKEDADSNKTMSFLQMTFLPATAVAAIFSMNVFDWTKDPPTVYPSFWIFWVVALILTTIVLGLYFGVKRYDRLKDEQKKVEENEKEEREDQQLYQSPVGDETLKQEKPSSRRKQRHRSRRDAKDTRNKSDDGVKYDPGYSKGSSVIV